MKQYKVTIGTISKGFREETYLLKDDVLKLIKDYNKYAKESLCNNLNTKTDTLCYFGQLGLITINELVDTFLGEELKSKINGENKK